MISGNQKIKLNISVASPRARLALVIIAFFSFMLNWHGGLCLAPGEAKAAKSSYDGQWTLHSLGGDKVLPYWTVSIGNGKFILRTDSPETKCSTTATMEMEGRDVTFTTTATNCRGDSKGDVDKGTLSLYGNTLTFISKTHGKKWVFVRVVKERPAAKSQPAAQAPSGKRSTAKSSSRNPIVVADPVEPAMERITVTNPGSTVKMGEVYVSWMAVRDASRYNFSLEGREDGGEFVETMEEVYNSLCEGMICSKTKVLKPGYYTVRIDSFYKIISSKVSLTVGAQEPVNPKSSKKSKARKAPPPPTPPSDITGPVGPVTEPTVSLFQWPAMSGATTYELHILKKGAAPENAIIHMGDHELLCKAEPCSVTLPNPITEGEYTWWVESSALSYGKERSFYVVDPSAPKSKGLEPAPAPKKKKSWRDGPG